MKRNILIALTLIAVGFASVFATQAGRQVISNTLSWDGIYQSTATSNLSAPYPGQVLVTYTDGNVPVLQVYDNVSGTWDIVPNADAAVSLASTLAVTGAVTANGDITLGSDEEDTVTINAPVKRVIHRDDFCNVQVIQSDGTAQSGVDTELNHIYTESSTPYYVQRIEQTATLSLARQQLDDCGLDVSGDVTANDGHEIVFAGNPLSGVYIVDSGSSVFYFEISLTITDISAFDGDIAFGVRLPAAQQDPPQHDGLNTYFIATLSDNAGDLDFEADVDGGGAANDDSGITWGDGDTKVVRFEIDGDGYAAYVDGTAITLTNVNTSGANDFTDGDKLVPFYYHTQGAQGAATGVVINYVEWGIGQL